MPTPPQITKRNIDELFKELTDELAKLRERVNVLEKELLKEIEEENCRLVEEFQV